MLKFPCSTISFLEICTFGLPYTALKNRGTLILEKNKIVFEKDSKAEWEIPYEDLKDVKGIFYLHLIPKNGKEKIIRTSRKDIKKIKKELLKKIKR